MNTYFDNSSTSYPKPPAVAGRITDYLLHDGGTYGRASYGRIVRTTMQVEACRDAVAGLMGADSPEDLIFTSGATSAVNALLKGVELAPGTTVWVSPMEHNAVMRVLEYLSQTIGIKVSIFPHLSDGTVDLKQLKKIQFSGQGVAMINHLSNVNGVIQPVRAIAEICKEENVVSVADVSQSLGCIPVDVSAWNVFAAFFSGHKGLLGPTGIGGFSCPFLDALTPYRHGGTGSYSNSYDMPRAIPDRFEAGTPNIVGIVGLLGAIEEKPQPLHTLDDFLCFMDALARLPGIHLYRALDSACQGEVCSFVCEGSDPSAMADLLYANYQIEVRSGLHCAPLAHRTLGTFPTGTVRISPSPYHTPHDFEYLMKAIADVSK